MSASGPSRHTSQVRFQVIAALGGFHVRANLPKRRPDTLRPHLDWGPVQTRIDRRPTGQGGCHLDRPNAALPAMCAFFYETSLSKWHPIAASDDVGHPFQNEAGHVFRFQAGRGSDLMPATFCGVPVGRDE